MFYAFQEGKRCNRLGIVPWRNTIPFQKLIGDHFGVDLIFISGAVQDSHVAVKCNNN